MLCKRSLLHISFPDENSDTASESDLEDLSQQNQTYQPYRDENPDPQTSEEKHNHQGTGASTMEPEVIRKKVKQSLAKKQQKARRTKRGEAGVVTRKRRENRSAIEQSDDGIW